MPNAQAAEDAIVQQGEPSSQGVAAAMAQPIGTQDVAGAVTQPVETQNGVAAMVQPNESSTQTQSKQDGVSILPARNSSSQACTEPEAENLIRQMQAKLEILKLQQQIDELDGQRNIKAKSVACFADVEGSLPKFTGDCEYKIFKWMQEFEKITNILSCTPAEQFLFARRMMTGSACQFMRTSIANNCNNSKWSYVQSSRKALV